jgi:hypothetical protein
MFMVVLEGAAASSWYGQDQDRRCTRQNEERCCSGLNEEQCSLYWDGDQVGSFWWLWRDVNALAVGSTSGLAESRSFSMWAGSHLFIVWVVLLDHWLPGWVDVMTDGQSAYPSWCQAPIWDHDQNFLFPFFCWTIALLFILGRSLWREDGSVVCSSICQWSVSRRTHNHILLSPLRLLVPFLSPLTTRGDYGRSILTCLHMGRVPGAPDARPLYSAS